MKEYLKKAWDVLLCVLLTPLVLIGALVLALYIPVDYVRYRRSAFYRDTRQKYELYSGGTQWIRLYNAMRAENLPLDFYLHTTDGQTYGYFRYQKILLVQDLPVEYEPKKQEWFVYYEDKDEQACTTLTEALEFSLEGFREIVGQNICDRAVLLTDRTHIPEEDLPHLDRCELLLGYDGKDGMVSAIKQWIERNRG